jgi:hypothetical protein
VCIQAFTFLKGAFVHTNRKEIVCVEKRIYMIYGNKKEKRTLKSELNRRVYFYQLLVTSKHKD